MNVNVRQHPGAVHTAAIHCPRAPVKAVSTAARDAGGSIRTAGGALSGQRPEQNDGEYHR